MSVYSDEDSELRAVEAALGLDLSPFGRITPAEEAPDWQPLASVKDSVQALVRSVRSTPDRLEDVESLYGLDDYLNDGSFLEEMEGLLTFLEAAEARGVRLVHFYGV